MGIFSSNKPHIATIIDIGSSSIGASAVLLYPDKKPSVLYTIRKDMAFQEKFNFDRFVLSMLETLENVVQELSSFPLPSHSDQTTLCVFSSPWYASQTRSVKKTFETTSLQIKPILSAHSYSIISILTTLPRPQSQPKQPLYLLAV